MEIETKRKMIKMTYIQMLVFEVKMYGIDHCVDKWNFSQNAHCPNDSLKMYTFP